MRVETDKFENFVLHEIDFYIKYFEKPGRSSLTDKIDNGHFHEGDHANEESGLIYHVLENWNNWAREKCEEELELEEKEIADLETRELTPAEKEEEIKKIRERFELIRLNNSGRWDFSFGDKIGNGHVSDLIDFDPIVEILKSYKQKFLSDMMRFKRILRNKGDVLHRDSELILRLSLWHSSFTNDPNGVLSPLGIYGIDIGSSMGHHEIGILNALEQQLWNPASDANHELRDKNIWKADLIRSQLLLFTVYNAFKRFLHEDIELDDRFSDILNTWIAWLRRVNMPEKLKELVSESDFDVYPSLAEPIIEGVENHQYDPVENVIRRLTHKLEEIKRELVGEISKIAMEGVRAKKQSDIGNDVFNSTNEQEYKEEADTAVRNFLDGETLLLSRLVESRVVINIWQNQLDIVTECLTLLKLENLQDLYDADKMGVLVEELKDKVGRYFQYCHDEPAIAMTSWMQGVLKKLFDITFFKADIPFAPIVQLVDADTSAWGGDLEVPTMIVVNKKKVQTADIKHRLLAYAALPHEVGHDISDSFVDGALMKSLSKMIADEDIKYKDIWLAWINEIFADIAGVALIGPAAILGLIAALDEGGVPGHVLKRSHSGDQYGSHPAPIIRIFIAVKFALSYFEDSPVIGQLDDIIDDFYSIYYEYASVMVLENEVTGGEIKLDELKRDVPKVLGIILEKGHVCLKGRTVIDLLNKITDDEGFKGLTKNFKKLLQL